MKLTDSEYKFLTSTCGGIYHCLIKHNDTIISDHEIYNLNDLLKVKESYTLKSTGANSIRIENERVAINYVHNDFMGKRDVIVELKNE